VVLASRTGRNHIPSQHVMGSTRNQCLTCIRSWCSSRTFPCLFSQSSARLRSGRSNMAVKACHMVVMALILATYRCCWAYKVEKFSFLMPNVKPYRVSTNHITSIVTVMWDVAVLVWQVAVRVILDQGFPITSPRNNGDWPLNARNGGVFPFCRRKK